MTTKQATINSAVPILFRSNARDTTDVRIERGTQGITVSSRVLVGVFGDSLAPYRDVVYYGESLQGRCSKGRST